MVFYTPEAVGKSLQVGRAGGLALQRLHALPGRSHFSRGVWRGVLIAFSHVHPEDVALFILARPVAASEPLDQGGPGRKFSDKRPR